MQAEQQLERDTLLAQRRSAEPLHVTDGQWQNEPGLPIHDGTDAKWQDRPEGATQDEVQITGLPSIPSWHVHACCPAAYA